MFRRSGSYACFFIEGSLPDDSASEFTELLQNRRFRTIENAASETTSVGWVTHADPTGNSFEPDDLDCAGALWLQMRIDQKKAPSKWLMIYRQTEERAAGRKLTPQERRDLRSDLASKLLARTLPAVKLIDALLVPQRRLLFLFATSNSVREAFLTLFHKTFSVSLAPADPYRLALSLNLSKESRDSLGDVCPVKWHRDSERARSKQENQTEEVGA